MRTFSISKAVNGPRNKNSKLNTKFCYLGNTFRDIPDDIGSEYRYEHFHMFLRADKGLSNMNQFLQQNRFFTP